MFLLYTCLYSLLKGSIRDNKPFGYLAGTEIAKSKQLASVKHHWHIILLSQLLAYGWSQTGCL